MFDLRNPSPRITGFGIACIDYIVVAPQTDAGGRSDAVDFTIQGGGLTGNSIVAASRLGASAAFIGRLGDDDIGDQVVSGLLSEGVDVSRVVRVPGAASLVSVVVVDSKTAERTIYSRLETNIECSADLIDIEPVRAAGAVLLDPHWKEGAMRVAAAANAAGVPVVCDANNPVRHSDLLSLCDYPILSRSSALRLTSGQDVREALRALLGLGARAAVITCGADGAFYAGPDDEGHVPAFSVDAVDTTGAGDAFHGAFAFAVAQGWSVYESVVFASGVAAISCKRLGGRAGLPGFKEAIDFISSRGFPPREPLR